MTDYYLRANTEAAMKNSFIAAGITIEGIDGEVVDLNGIRLDIGWIGPVTWIDPVTEQPQTDTRFHANLRVAGELTPAQIAALPILDPPPSQPMRVWA